MNSPSIRFCIWNLVAVPLLPGVAFAGSIVPDLNDADAIFSSTTPFSSVGTTVAYPAPTLANGVTLAAQFTPNSTDITNSATGPVLILETGGTSNGAGLYILNGDLWFLASSAVAPSSGTAMTVPTGPTDSDGSGALGLLVGALTPDVQHSVWASLNAAGLRLVVSIDGVDQTFPLTNVAPGFNWTGNRTVGFGINNTGGPSTAASRGGLAELGMDASLFNANNAIDLNGTVALGQIFNAVSAVPEPASATLLVVCGLVAALGARRR